MDEEAVEQVIAAKIRDWDAAYARKDVHGYLGHCVPDDPAFEERCRHEWSKVMFCADLLTSRSTLKDFTLRGEHADTKVDVQRTMTFRDPDNRIGRWVLGWLKRFVFEDRETRALQWVKTPEGWLCKSDTVLSSKFRIRRNRWEGKQNGPG